MTPGKTAYRNCGRTGHFTQEVDANGGYGPRLLPLGIFKRPKFRLRVCAGCGLVEWFVAARLLPDVCRKFEREP